MLCITILSLVCLQTTFSQIIQPEIDPNFGKNVNENPKNNEYWPVVEPYAFETQVGSNNAVKSLNQPVVDDVQIPVDNELEASQQVIPRSDGAIAQLNADELDIDSKIDNNFGKVGSAVPDGDSWQVNNQTNCFNNPRLKPCPILKNSDLSESVDSNEGNSEDEPIAKLDSEELTESLKWNNSKNTFNVSKWDDWVEEQLANIKNQMNLTSGVTTTGLDSLVLKECHFNKKRAKYHCTAWSADILATDQSGQVERIYLKVSFTIFTRLNKWSVKIDKFGKPAALELPRNVGAKQDELQQEG